MVVVAGTLENIDLERFRSGQKRDILNETVHPKWEKGVGNSASIYYDVGLLLLKEVNIKRQFNLSYYQKLDVCLSCVCMIVSPLALSPL